MNVLLHQQKGRPYVYIGLYLKVSQFGKIIIKNIDNKSDNLFIPIELLRKAHICSACGSRTDRIHEYHMQTVKNVSSRSGHLPRPSQAPLPL